MDIFNKYPIHTFVPSLTFLCKRKEFCVHSKCKLDHKSRDGDGIKKLVWKSLFKVKQLQAPLPLLNGGWSSYFSLTNRRWVPFKLNSVLGVQLLFFKIWPIRILKNLFQSVTKLV